MSYKDSKSLHGAILIGTIGIGTMFGMHLIGVLALPVLPGIEVADTAELICVWWLRISVPMDCRIRSILEEGQ